MILGAEPCVTGESVSLLVVDEAGMRTHGRKQGRGWRARRERMWYEVVVGLDAIDAASTDGMLGVRMEEKRMSRAKMEILEGEEDGGEFSGAVGARAEVCTHAQGNSRRSAGHVDNDRGTNWVMPRPASLLLLLLPHM